jgi:hypothetical protein
MEHSVMDSVLALHKAQAKAKQELVESCTPAFNRINELLKEACTLGQTLEKLGMLDDEEGEERRDGKLVKVKIRTDLVKGLEGSLDEFRSVFRFKTAKELKQIEDGRAKAKAEAKAKADAEAEKDERSLWAKR